jgi:hypothetical protein
MVPLAVAFALTVALSQMYRVSNRCTRVMWMGVPFSSYRPPDGWRHGLVDHCLCRLPVSERWLSGWLCGMRYLRHRRVCADFTSSALLQSLVSQAMHDFPTVHRFLAAAKLYHLTMLPHFPEVTPRIYEHALLVLFLLSPLLAAC